MNLRLANEAATVGFAAVLAEKVKNIQVITLSGDLGAGKTTFFSMILGDIEPSSGKIQIGRNIRIGYLPQEASFRSTHTVISELTEGDETISRLIKEKEALEADDMAGLDRYGQILHELEPFPCDCLPLLFLTNEGISATHHFATLRSKLGGHSRNSLAHSPAVRSCQWQSRHRHQQR